MLMLERLIDSLAAWRDERRRKRYIAQHDAAQAKADKGTLTDDELIYAAFSRCTCGAGLAYPRGIGGHGFWDCSDILTGRAVLKGKPGSKTHDDRWPFVFYEIKSEQQPSANKATTRPKPAKAAAA